MKADEGRLQLDIPHLTFLRLRAVMQRTDLTESTLYRLIQAGEFPAPFKISERTIAWREDLIDQWCLAKAGGHPGQGSQPTQMPAPKKSLQRVRGAIERVRA